MIRNLSLLTLIVCLIALTGCAARTDDAAPPAPTPTHAENAAPVNSEPAGVTGSDGLTVSESRSAPAQPPLQGAGAPSAGFRACIDGIEALGPVRLGMTLPEVRRAAPWLKLDKFFSNRLSAPIITLCGERVWNYTVGFDADCRARSIRLNGPERMERVFKESCKARAVVDDNILNPFKWQCDYGSSTFSVIEEKKGLNSYTLFRVSEPEGQGRCLLPKLWD